MGPSKEQVANGTIRREGDEARIFFDGYWIRYYAPPEDTPATKRRLLTTRIEYRAPDPACNPYLTFACMLAAGLEGIEKGYEAPAPVEENVFEMSEKERVARGIEHLPGSLWEAIEAAEGSDLLRNCLGEHLFESLLLNKKFEWSNFTRHVTDWETSRYLPIL